jgi:hypothetical protein
MSGCEKIRFKYDGSDWEQGIRCGVKKFDRKTQRWQYYTGDEIPDPVLKHFAKQKFGPVMVLLTGGNKGHRWKHQELDNKQEVEDYLKAMFGGSISFPKKKSAFTYVLSPDGAREKSATAEKLAGAAEVVTLERLIDLMNRQEELPNEKKTKTKSQHADLEPLRVLLSGGSEGVHWSKEGEGFANKEAVETFFIRSYPHMITFPKKSTPGEIEWVLLPKGVQKPSDTAMKRIGKTKPKISSFKKLTHYMDHIYKRRYDEATKKQTVSPIRVLLSGGSEGVHWNRQGYRNKKEVENFFIEEFKGMIVFPKNPKRGEIDFFLLPDGVRQPSDTATNKVGVNTNSISLDDLIIHLNSFKEY